MHPWLNWIEHRPPKAGIARSNRAGCARINISLYKKTVMAKLFLICGFLGAGKTTLSKRFAMEHNVEYMNVDETVMQMFTAGEYEYNWEKCFATAEEILWQQIQQCAAINRNVVFDVGFWTRKSRDIARQRAMNIGMQSVLYYVYAPDAILKQRIAMRPGKIAENNIKKFDTIRKMFEEPQEDEEFVRIDNF